MYLQDKPSTTPSQEPSGDTEETTSIHFTMVYKSLSHGTEDASDFDKVPTINCKVNSHITYRFAT